MKPRKTKGGSVKWIGQKHRRGCGVAAFAMFTGISYEESLVRLDPTRKPGELLKITDRHILRALRGMGRDPHVYWVNKTFPFTKLTQRARRRRPLGSRSRCATGSQTRA